LIVNPHVSLEDWPIDLKPYTPAELTFSFGEWDGQKTPDEVPTAKLAKILGPLGLRFALFLRDCPHFVGQREGLVGQGLFVILAAYTTPKCHRGGSM
jgi:hypothetical protein